MRRLALTVNKRKVYSHPWNFEAMCLMDDNKNLGDIVEITLPTLICLFDGTKASEAFIKKLKYDKLYELCLMCASWYASDASLLKDISSGNGNKSASLRSVYKIFFDAWGILPGALGREDPAAIFRLVSNSSTEPEDLPAEIAALYGM